MEKLPSFLVETPFLQDIRSVTGRISEVAEAATHAEDGRREGVVLELLRLVLSLESTIAVWCLRHVQLGRTQPNPAPGASLTTRLEAAIEDANRIAERLHQLTGSIELQVDWLPSAQLPVISMGWTLQNTLLEAMAAEMITLECYGRLIHHIRFHDSSTACMLEEVTAARRGRLSSQVNEALQTLL